MERHHMIDSAGRRSILIACGVLLAGCVAADPPSAAADAGITADGLQSAMAAAFADAEKQTGIARADLKLQSAEVVTWPDGSLGCPKPGGMYTQSLVPGYRIRIHAGEKVLDYHASARGQQVLCPPGRAVEPILGEAM
jgi:hypothetical protein